MVTGNDETSRRAEDVIKHVLAREAPQELANFDLISAAFFEDPERALRTRPGRDKPAAYGAAEVYHLVTLVLLDAFCALLADQAKDTVVRAGKGTWRWLKSRRRSRPGRDEVLDTRVAATEENARLLGEHVFAASIELGADADTALRIKVVVIDVVRKAGDDGDSRG